MSGLGDGRPFAIPQISQDDLGTFFAEHFSDGAVRGFSSQFLGNAVAALSPRPADQSEPANEPDDEDDNGLGYYSDGVKRTLTDEQIAMFRHSELHALERAAEQRAASRLENSSPGADVKSGFGTPPSGVIGDGDDEPPKIALSGDGRKRKRKGKASRPPKKEPKEDLRKRTWDVVEEGLDSLDYG